MLDADTQLSSNAPHPIIMTFRIDQAKPTDDRYERSDFIHRFVSCRAVWDALNDRHGSLLYSKLKLTTRLFQQVPETSSMASYMWEAYSHARISAGGVFTLIPMTVEGTDLVSCYTMSESIMISHLTLTKFMTKDPPTSTQENTKYYIPSASNNATFDAFLLSNSKQIALQTTVSSSRSLTSSGFDELTINAYHQATSNTSLPSFPIALPGPSSANRQMALCSKGSSSSYLYWIKLIVSLACPQRRLWS